MPVDTPAWVHENFILPRGATLERVALDDETLAALDVSLLQPGVYRLPWSADVLSPRAVTREITGYRVDAHPGPVFAQLQLGGDPVYVRLAPDGIEAYAADFSNAEAGIEVTIEEEPPLEVAAPTLTELLARPVPAHLHEPFEALATHEEGWRRVAAAGFLLRAWAPPTADDRAREIAAILRGRGYLRRIARWVESLGDDVLRRAEEHGLDVLWELPDAVEALDGVPHEHSCAACAQVVADRDAVESLLEALLLARRGVLLERWRGHVDEQLLPHVTRMADARAQIVAALGGPEVVRALGRDDVDRACWWLGPRL